jgi:hypothetical protein
MRTMSGTRATPALSSVERGRSHELSHTIANFLLEVLAVTLAYFQ